MMCEERPAPAAKTMTLVMINFHDRHDAHSADEEEHYFGEITEVGLPSTEFKVTSLF
jgi:hypothetical protein